METSVMAYEKVKVSAGTVKQRILDYLKNEGERGATAEEIQIATGYGGSNVRGRLIELLKMKLANKSDSVRKTRSGCSAVVWVASPSDSGGPSVQEGQEGLSEPVGATEGDTVETAPDGGTVAL